MVRGSNVPLYVIVEAPGRDTGILLDRLSEGGRLPPLEPEGHPTGDHVPTQPASRGSALPQPSITLMNDQNLTQTFSGRLNLGASTLLTRRTVASSTPKCRPIPTKNDPRRRRGFHCGFRPGRTTKCSVAPVPHGTRSYSPTVSHGGSCFGGTPPVVPQHEKLWQSLEHHAEWLGLKFIRAEMDWRQWQPEKSRFPGTRPR